MLITASSSLQNIQATQAALDIFTVLQIATYSYPKQTCVSDGATYDYIIVGGGTAGCVIANRLAEDNDATVLLIESGGDPEGDSNIPSLLLFIKQTEAAWNYTIKNNELPMNYRRKLKDDMSLGRLLGGTSSAGYLLYNTGNRYDYDNWANIVNDTTWRWENVLPYLQKSQRLIDPKLLNTDNGKLYGKQGKIGLSLFRTKMGERFFTAFEQTGSKRVPSFNGNVSLGYSDAMYTLANGIRQSTANSYLIPIRKNAKLHVLKNSMVNRIIFDANKNAIGVEVETCGKKLVTIKSRIEVILSAGIVNSPKILMLSGIGPREHLDEHNIETVVDLPVGRNLQDHLSVVVIYNMTNLVVPFRPWNPYKYPASLLVGFVSLNETEKYPDYHTINFINYPLYLMMYCTFTYGYTDDVCNQMIKTDTNSMMMYSVISRQRFKSKGKILLKSRDFRVKPIIETGYYSAEEDVEHHAKAVEHFVKIGETNQFKKLGGVLKDPQLEICNGLVKYSIDYWKCYVRAMSTSLHNYSSTCSMGSVVDSRLRVYGVKRLRVADASIMPNPTAGGTLGATIMIGEKIADMIKEDNRGLRQL